MFYFKKTPFWLQFFFPSLMWKINVVKKKIFLTFDDGPHPIHTVFVLDELKKYQAKATFFCVGENVRLYPSIYKRIVEEGHAVGNHTFMHLNGSKTKNKIYIEDIETASNYIDSSLFRPPYGRIKYAQIKTLETMPKPYKIIMWTVLSGDFDLNITKEKCLKNVLSNTNNGSIVVFHDSEKAAERMRYALPKVLNNLTENGYELSKIVF